MMGMKNKNLNDDTLENKMSTSEKGLRFIGEGRYLKSELRRSKLKVYSHI